MSRKLSEHVEDELFNKEKRTIVGPKIKKVVPKPPQSEPRVIKEGEQPVKKKKPYYRKKYSTPKLVEVIVPEPVEQHLFIKGLIIGVIVTSIIGRLIWVIY